MKINICAIVIGSDESLLKIKLPSGFEFRKINLQESFIKKKVQRLDGQLFPPYLNSKLCTDERNPQFICIVKEDTFTENSDTYIEKQFRTIEKIFSMLKLYKQGDITFYDIFYLIDSNYCRQEFLIDAKIFCKEKYCLNTNEISEVEILINNYDKEYEKLKQIISHYFNSTKFIDNFLQLQYLISIAEIMLKKRSDKKYSVAKRLSIILGKSNDNMKEIYDTFIRLYNLRNASIHNGDVDNITDEDVSDARQIIIDTIKYFLNKIKEKIATNPDISFQELKRITIDELAPLISSHN